MTAVEQCGWCAATENLVMVGRVEQVSGPPVTRHACGFCRGLHGILPLGEHPENSCGGVLYRSWWDPAPAPGRSRRAGRAGRDFAREVAGTAEAVIWELDPPDPDWPAVRQLAEKLLRTALQAPVPGSEEQSDSPPATVADIAKARRLVPEARRQLDDVERAVMGEPCDVALAYELAGALAGTVGVVLLILRSLSGEGER